MRGSWFAYFNWFYALALLWLILAAAFFFWDAYALLHNAAAIICGYPETAGKAYADCFATNLQLRSGLYASVFANNWYWIALPAIALVAVGKFSKKGRGKEIDTKS